MHPRVVSGLDLSLLRLLALELGLLGLYLGSLSVDLGLAPPGIGFGHLGLDVSVLEVLGLSWVSWRCISVPRAWIRAC